MYTVYRVRKVAVTISEAVKSYFIYVERLAVLKQTLPAR